MHREIKMRDSVRTHLRLHLIFCEESSKSIYVGTRNSDARLSPGDTMMTAEWLGDGKLKVTKASATCQLWPRSGQFFFLWMSQKIVAFAKHVW